MTFFVILANNNVNKKIVNIRLEFNLKSNYAIMIKLIKKFFVFS